MSLRVVISCEHATHHVPPDLRRYFRGKRRLLSGHQAYDRGALHLARSLARRFRAPLVSGRVTRLVVDLNRSATHPRVFSRITRGLDPAIRARILRHWYEPYRQEVQDRIAKLVGEGHRVLHLSVHSFTPVLDGRVRQADLGLLYDPQRTREKEFCRLWQQHLRHLASGLRVRRNYPYRGVADGFTTFLRRHYVDRKYLGVELELNQRWTRDPRAWRRLQSVVMTAFGSTLRGEP